MIERFSKYLVGSAFVLLIAGCGNHIIDGKSRDLSIRYDRPTLTAENGSLIEIGVNYGASFSQTLSRLRQAGFEIVSADRSSGEIHAESNANNLISCGRLSVGTRGDSSIFPANIQLSVLEVPAGAGQSSFLRREVASHTSVVIRLGVVAGEDGAIFASIRESHVVNLALSQAADGQEIYNQSIQFSGAESRRFRRGVECGTSGEVRAIILGS